MKQFIKVKWIFIAVTMLLSFGIAGCDQDSETTEPSEEKGELVVSLTDAVGDFANYTVDVKSLSLTKINGAVVDVLPLTTKVDFSQYTEMTELLTTATVPSGVYTSACLTLNYENADIWVENESGENVKVATIVDEEGNSVTEFKVTVDLTNSKKLVVAPRILAYLALDFDLQASNTVEFDNSGLPTVIVSPSLLAEIEPDSNKIHKIRGPLKEVNVDENSFKVKVKPFFHLLAGSDESFGALNVNVNDTTIYDINGQSYTGQAGLMAMNEMAASTAVLAIGDLKLEPLRFEATEVRAGSSVHGGNKDRVKGHVISRNGNSVVIKGATIIRTDGSVLFNDNVTVQLDESTVVKRQFSKDEYTIADISVGQRISIFGTITNDNQTELALDATNASARLLLTTISGKVAETTPADANTQLNINLKKIGRTNAAGFDFTGTGTTATDDATSESYEINTGLLDISGLSNGKKVKVCGFVQPFGQAPADFNAQSMITMSDLQAFIKVKWAPVTSDAFSAITTESITLNIDNTSLFHHAGQGKELIDLSTLATAPVLKPGTAGHYKVSIQGDVKFYKSFTDFTADLAERLAAGKKVGKIFATGQFEAATATMTATFIKVALK